MDYTLPRKTTVTPRPTVRTTTSGETIVIEHRPRTRVTRPPLERFMDKVDKRADGCWYWTGYVEPATGYGKWRMPEDEHSTPAHRAAYRMLIGPIPEGRYLDHLCRVRQCVNPAHLEPVTPQVNTDRGMGRRRGTCTKGHALVGENAGVRADGRRYCKACSRDRQAKHQRKAAR